MGTFTLHLQFKQYCHPGKFCLECPVSAQAGRCQIKGKCLETHKREIKAKCLSLGVYHGLSRVQTGRLQDRKLENTRQTTKEQHMINNIRPWT